MSEKKTQAKKADDLRRQAEEKARENTAQMPENLDVLSPEEERQVLHELRVHQIELEMQNVELRRTREELEASRARYFDLYDLAPVGYLTLSEQGLILEANLTAATLFGAARGALVKQPLTRFILREDQDIYYLHRKQLFETSMPQVYDMRLVKKNGTQFWARLEATAAPDADGAPVCRVVVIDITERKQTEEALRQSEATFRSVFGAVPVGICKMKDRVYQSANKNWCDSFGYPEESILGKTTRFLYESDEEYHRVEQELYTQLLERGLTSAETRLRRSDGVYRDVVLIAAPLRSEDLEAGIAVVVNDITERKWEEEALRESEKRYRDIFEQAPIGIGLASENGKVVTLNKIMESITGYSMEDFKKVNLADTYVNPEDRKKVLESARRYGALNDYQVRLKRKDGTIYDALLNISLVHIGNEIFFQSIVMDITERKRTEEALRQSEERYRKMVEAVTAYTYMVNVEEGKAVSTRHSQGCLAVTGYTPEDYQSDPNLWYSMIHPEDQETVRNHVSRALAGNDVPAIEHRIIHRNGSVRWVRDTIVLVRDISDRLIRYDGLVEDITERKQAAEALREGEERLRLAFEGGNMGLWDWNIDTNKIARNQGWADITGYSLEETQEPGLWRQIIHPDDLGKDREKVMALLEGIAPTYESEYRLRTKSGDYKWVQARGRITNRDHGGKPTRFSGIIIDINERKRAQEELRQAEEKYRSIFDNVVEGIFQTTPKGRFLTVNPALAHIYGYSSPEELIETITDIGRQVYVNPDERNEFLRILQEKGKITGFELQLKKKDGSTFWASINARAVYDENGNILYHAGTSEDITERKQAERRQGLALKILELLNSTGEREDIFREVLLTIKNFLEIEAVGIRLREGDDFPYYTTNGFTEQFVEMERHLCARDQAGEIIYDSKGNPYLECMCGNIICGRTDPALPFFTKGGSFWTNCTTKLLASTTEKERQTRTRNRCNGEGYESVALIPLKSENRTIGLLQLNDKRSGRFTLDLINFLEGIGSSVGILVERKTAERELRESESKYKELYDEAPIGYHEIDREGRITRVNRTEADLLGYTPGEMIGKYVWEFVSRDQRKLSKKAVLEKISQKKGLEGFEREYVCKDGRRIYAYIKDRLILDSNGELIGFRSTLEDITERKKAEEARMLLETAINQSAEMIVITDSDGTIEYVNPAFEKITGYAQTEAVGQTLRLLKSGLQDEDFYKELWDTIKKGKIWKGHFNNRKKNGLLYHEEATISPVFNSKGRIINYVAVKRDITQEMELENQLFHAQKMESIGLLAGGVAHDFNNILTTIMGYSSLLQMSPEMPEKLRKRIEEIEKASIRGAEITSQLLTFSRKQTPRLEKINLNNVINNSIRFIKQSLQLNIVVETRLSENLGLVNADSTQIQQILMNLCINSRDAMPQGGKILIETENIEIEQNYIRTHYYSSPGPHVLLTLSDTGMGMNKEVLSRIFEPFFTTKPVDKGTGLGLSVVYGIVKNHNGIINVYSVEGKGTTFKIYLPQTSGREKVRIVKEPVIKGGKETVLIVEDEEMILRLVSSILEEYGYKCLTAANGLEGLHIYQERGKDIDLVILDVVMPKMNGPELFVKIMKINPGAKVIMSSGFSLENEKNLAEQGVKAFVPKPYQERSLAWTVRKVLDKKK